MRAHEQIVEQLQKLILSGELPAGSHLPSERAMMINFHVSRPTVREALRVAENLGLVTVRQGDPGGPLVLAEPSVGISRVLDGLLRAECAAATDLLELRMVLDGTAAQLATGRPPAEQAGIADAYRQMHDAPDLAAFVRLDAGFHYQIAVASGNRLLRLVLEALDEPIQRLIESGLQAPASGHTRELTLRQHGEILAAITAGEGNRASRAARQHLYDLYAAGLGPEQAARLRRILGEIQR